MMTRERESKHNNTEGPVHSRDSLTHHRPVVLRGEWSTDPERLSEAGDAPSSTCRSATR